MATLYTYIEVFMIDKKSIILSKLNNNEEKAIVGFKKENSIISGYIKFYNLKENLDGLLTLVVMQNGNLNKIGLVVSNNYCTFKTNFEIENSFSIAIIKTTNGNSTPLYFGATNDIENQKTKFFSRLDLFEKDNFSINDAKELLESNGLYKEKAKKLEATIKEKEKTEYFESDFYDDYNEVENLITKTLQDSNDALKCDLDDEEYLDNSIDENLEKEPVKNAPFYSQIEDQINSLMKKYGEEEILEKLIPNSTWVKVDFGDDGEYYVLGLIKENNTVKSICYGVPGVFNVKPPKELEEVSQWLPINPDDPTGFGYYISYQDAINGENIKFEIV